MSLRTIMATKIDNFARNYVTNSRVMINPKIPKANNLYKISDIIGEYCYKKGIIANFSNEGDKVVLTISKKPIPDLSGQDTISSGYLGILNAKLMQESMQKVPINPEKGMLKQIFTALVNYTHPKN